MGDEELVPWPSAWCLQCWYDRLYHRAHQALESLVGDVEGEKRWDRQLYRMSQV